MGSLGSFIEYGVSAVIPALNEGKTIRSVVENIAMSPYVNEIIVVDNGSTDNTYEEAKKAGARVLVEPERGFGKALKVAIEATVSNWVLKLDGDMLNVSSKWVDCLVGEINASDVILVKGWWNNMEDPMPVTNLVAKPCIQLFFPNLEHINMPLSGIYLFNKRAIEITNMPDNWAFDLSLLIQASERSGRIQQAYLGEVYDCLKPISNYKRMSFELVEHMYQRKHSKRYLFVMAHADDAEIWCGGTIIKLLSEGHSIKIVIVTSSIERKKEALDAFSNVPRVTLEFMRLEEFSIINSRENIQLLSDLFLNFRPDSVITHHKDDIHEDHRACFDMCNSALISIPRVYSPKSFYMCQTYFNKVLYGSIYSPTTFIDISEHAHTKYEMISKYKSQDTTYWKEMASAMDLLNGLQCNVRKAESFQLVTSFNSQPGELL